MRRWRVGTISMGLLLVSSGLLLIAGQIDSAAAARAAFRWWPLVLVALGLEVLVYTYLRKEPNERVIYDTFSIIMILIMICAGLGIKIFQEAGFAPKIIREIESENYVVPITEKEIGIDDQVKKLVLFGGTCSNLEIRSTQTSSIIVSGDANLRAVSRDEAVSRLQQTFQVVSRRIGDSIYLDLDGAPSVNGRIIIPDSLQVEVNAPDSPVSVLAERVNGSWLIRTQRNADLTFAQGADVLLTVMGEEPLKVKGNLKWNPVQTGNDRSGAGTAAGEDGQRAEIKLDDRTAGEVSIKIDKNPGGSYEPQAHLGSGIHHFTVISGGGEVSARQLP